MIPTKFYFVIILLMALVSNNHLASSLPTSKNASNINSASTTDSSSLSSTKLSSASSGESNTTSSSKESSEEGSSTPNSNDISEEDIYIIFFKDSDGDSNSTKRISKRDINKHTYQKSESKVNNLDDGNTTNETDAQNPSNSTSKENSSENSTITEIILLPPYRQYRPRPILIDIIFFRVNNTNFNQTGPRSPLLFGGQGVGHSNPINSDEDSTTVRKSMESGENSTTPKSQTHSKGRRRRDTIFSHLTNTSQTTTSATVNASSDANNNTGTNSTMSTTPSSQEANADESDKTPTTTLAPENSVIFIFKEIIEYGGNVTKALFGIGKVEEEDSNNVNSNARNGSESSGADDNDDSTIHTKIVPSSNQNSSNSHKQPSPRNGSFSILQGKLQ